MAFKMKNPSVMKMAKQAGAAMKMKAPMKMGHSPKKVMKGDDKESGMKMKKESSMKMKKESGMKMKKESGMKLMEKTPKKMKSPMKDTDKNKRAIRKEEKRKALQSVGEGNYKNALERAMDRKYGLGIGPESGADKDTSRKTGQKKP